MKTFSMIAFVCIAILIVISIFIWVNISIERLPEGWKIYQNEKLGFGLWHPQNMEVSFSRQTPEIIFLLEGPLREEEIGAPPYDGIWFQARRLPVEEGVGLVDIARERTSNPEPITFAGYQGYRYIATDEDEGSQASVILISPRGNEILEVSYSLQDPENRGYQQIVEQMLASFKVRGGR